MLDDEWLKEKTLSVFQLKIHVPVSSESEALQAIKVPVFCTCYCQQEIKSGKNQLKEERKADAIKISKQKFGLYYNLKDMHQQVRGRYVCF